MYKFLIVLSLALAVIGCRSKKETVQKAYSSVRSDSTHQTFKGSLSDSSFKQSDVEFTTWEYEYPQQTPDEKKNGITPKPRVKKKTEGKLHQSQSEHKKQEVSADQSQVQKQEVKKTEDKQVVIKPVFNYKFWLVIGAVVAGAGAFLVYKFKLIDKLGVFFSRFNFGSFFTSANILKIFASIFKGKK